VKLDSVGAVVSELGTIYRQWRREELSEAKAKTGVHILNALRQAIEGGALDERVASLERGHNEIRIENREAGEKSGSGEAFH
jgi:hypothetical protein